MNFNKHKLLLAGLVTLHLLFNATVAQAALANDNTENLVVNGSFNFINPDDGATYQNSPFLVGYGIEGWTAFDRTNGATNTVDIMDGANNFGFKDLTRFGAAPSATPDGETWLGLGRSNSTEGTQLQDEGIQQTISFNQTGTYELSWYEGNFGFTSSNSRVAFSGANSIQAQIAGNSFNNAASNIISVGSEWVQRSYTFDIDSIGDQSLTFNLTGPNRSYLSLDGVSITAVSAVPEPESWAMMFAGLMLLGFQARKRTLNS